jgi:hypothetical protein
MFFELFQKRKEEKRGPKAWRKEEAPRPCFEHKSQGYSLNNSEERKKKSLKYCHRRELLVV